MKPFNLAPVFSFPLSLAVALVLGLATGVCGEKSEAAWMRAQVDGTAGQPSMAERVALQIRQRDFGAGHRRATIMVFPVRIGLTADTACAVKLAQALARAGICKTSGVNRPVVLAQSQTDAGDRALWKLARDFRSYLRKNLTDADFALYASYAVTPDQHAFNGVQFVLCDRRGEWVFVDGQDLVPAEQRETGPATKAACDALVVQLLARLVAMASADGPSAGRSHPAGRTTAALAR